MSISNNPVPVCVRKQGRVLTVFLDDNRPVPFVNFDDEPMGFPMTVNESQLLAMFPGRPIRYIEEARPENPLAKRPSDMEVNKFMRDTSNVVALVPPTAAVAPGSVAYAPQTQDANLQRALQYFRILVAQKGVAAKNKQARVDLQVETCLNLILAIWPASKDAVEAARIDAERFSL